MMSHALKFTQLNTTLFKWSMAFLDAEGTHETNAIHMLDAGVRHQTSHHFHLQYGIFKQVQLDVETGFPEMETWLSLYC